MSSKAIKPINEIVHDEHAEGTIRLFLHCLRNQGVEACMRIAIGTEVTGVTNQTDTAQVLFLRTLQKLDGGGGFLSTEPLPSFDIDRVINEAPSLAFLVAYAREVRLAVFGPDSIPSDEVVNACLELYHGRMLVYAITGGRRELPD